jgi:RNA polymerase sigma factor (sigma-70 family)
MTYADLDRLLDVPAEDFPDRIESLARELDERQVALEALGEETTLPGVGDGEGTTSFTRQVLSLPRLDREGEALLARRYALVKRRFYHALRRLGLAGEEESMEEIFCRETLSKGRCECRSCKEWESKVKGRSRSELKRRCREFNQVRNAFIEGSLYIVVLALSRFSNSRVSREDLLQEGSASLFRAVDRFDWRKGVRFRTYAEYWINQAFMEAIYNQSRTVRVPAWVQKATRKINQTRAKMGGQDTDEERARVAASLELPEEKVAEILEDNRQTISLDWEKAKGQSGSFSETLTGEGDTMDEAIDREKKTPPAPAPQEGPGRHSATGKDGPGAPLRAGRQGGQDPHRPGPGNGDQRRAGAPDPGVGPPQTAGTDAQEDIGRHLKAGPCERTTATCSG